MVIQNKRHTVILHDNALLALEHAAHFNWELFDHPPHSPDLAPNYCCLLTYQ
jgi:hypothetical protein